MAADSDSRNRRWWRAYASTSADHFSSWLCRVVAFGCRVKNGGKWYSRGNSKAGGPAGGGFAAAAAAEEEEPVVVAAAVVGSGEGEGEGWLASRLALGSCYGLLQILV